MTSNNGTANLPQSPEPAFYRLADIIRTALSRSSIYRRIAPAIFRPRYRWTAGRREDLQEWISDPTGFRPMTACEVQQNAAGGRVRRVAAAPAKSSLRRK